MTLLEGEALLIRRRMAYADVVRAWNAWLVFKVNPFGAYDYWKARGMMGYLDALKVPR